MSHEKLLLPSMLDPQFPAARKILLTVSDPNVLGLYALLNWCFGNQALQSTPIPGLESLHQTYIDIRDALVMSDNVRFVIGAETVIYGDIRSLDNVKKLVEGKQKIETELQQEIRELKEQLMDMETQHEHLKLQAKKAGIDVTSFRSWTSQTNLESEEDAV